jgi:alpha-L-fucosidase
MKRKCRKIILATSYFFTTLTCIAQTNPIAPKPYGAIPSARQLKWHETEMYCLIHFTSTTFENEERGYGDAPASIVNPKKMDALQIVSAAKAGGFRGIVYVTKHHEGFAMWPTKTSTYNISQSPWRNGKGDIVREFQLAAKKTGLKFGIYCSPWDRNNLNYGTPAYVEDYRNQLKELYTNYGELFMSWHDGANGGDGYYGGKKEERKVDPANYYDWYNTWKITRSLQPNAAIFSDVGPDVRWVGNENGFAPETSWATINVDKFKGSIPMPGFTSTHNLGSGDRGGKQWIPFEADVPLRNGWFYHAEDDTTVKSKETLFDMYCKTVGRGGCLDLGLAPNRDGLLHQNDVTVLEAFGKLLKQTFANNLAKQALITLSNIRAANKKAYGATHLTDGDRYSYWATDDKIHEATVKLTYKKPITFDIIQVKENIKLGQRIDSIHVDIFKDQKWQRLANATSIGSNRIIRLTKAAIADQVRICVYAPVGIAVSEIGLFKQKTL